MLPIPSVAAATVKLEICLFCPNGDDLDVPELGTFDTPAAARPACALLRMWLHHGIFGPELRAAVAHGENKRFGRAWRKNTAGLLWLPDALMRRNIDPAFVQVKAVPQDGRVSAGGGVFVAASEAGEQWRLDAGHDPDDDSDDDGPDGIDTTLQPVEVQYELGTGD